MDDITSIFAFDNNDDENEYKENENKSSISRRERKLEMKMKARLNSKLNRKNKKKESDNSILKTSCDQSSFIQDKNKVVNELKEIEKDKSRAGSIDVQIIDFINALNELEYCYSTSSCAGRIIVIKSFQESQKNKKFNIEWIYLTHDIRDDIDQAVDEIITNIEKINTVNIDEEIWIKLEPPIVSLRILNFENAKYLLDLFRTNGFKNSGIRSLNHDGSVHLSLVDTHRIETLIGDHYNRLMLSKEYLKILYEKANHKLMASRKRIDHMKEIILDIISKQQKSK